MFLLKTLLKFSIKISIFKKIEKDNVNEKLLAYNRSNRAVAILCNHQRAVPKTFEKSMENMKEKLQTKKDQIAEAEKELKKAKSDLKNLKTVAAEK